MILRYNCAKIPHLNQETFFDNFILVILFYLLCHIMLQGLLKVVTADPPIWASITFGKNGPNISIWPEWIFFLNFNSSNFYLLTVSCYLLRWFLLTHSKGFWPKRDFFEGDIFQIFRYIIFFNLFSAIMLKTLKKVDKWNMKLRLAKFWATIRPTLLNWSKRKRIFKKIPESNFYLLIFHYEATRFEKLQLYMAGKLEDILIYKVA